jgi:hypothetical protein
MTGSSGTGSRNPMQNNSIVVAVERELALYPGVKMETQERGKHSRLLFERGGQSRFLTIPKTPSDWRSDKNAITAFRKTMRELGAPRIGGEPKIARKAGKRGSVANFSLTDKILILHIPDRSKLISRFRTKDGKAAAHWKIELRSSPDLTAPPLVVVTRTELPPGVTKMYGVAGGFTPGSGAWRLTLGRTAFPALNAVDEITSTPVRLYQDNGDELVFQLPKGTIPTGFRKRDEEPVESADAPRGSPADWVKVDAPQPVEERTPWTKDDAPQAEPLNGFKDQPMVLQFPKQTVSVEAAIAILNKAKRRLGSNLRFTIEEGGYLSAVHRIGK